jgi:hypothetical protein
LVSRDVQLRLTSTGVDELVEKFDDLIEEIDTVLNQMDDLDAHLDELSAQRAEPSISVRGLDESLAKIQALKVALDDLNARQAETSLTSPGGVPSSLGGNVEQAAAREFLAGPGGSFTRVNTVGNELLPRAGAAEGGFDEFFYNSLLRPVDSEGLAFTTEDSDKLAQYGIMKSIAGGLGGGVPFLAGNGAGGMIRSLFGAGGGEGEESDAALLGEAPEGGLLGLPDISNGLLMFGAALPALGVIATGLTEGATGVAAAVQGLGAFGILGYPTISSLFTHISAVSTAASAIDAATTTSAREAAEKSYAAALKATPTDEKSIVGGAVNLESLYKGTAASFAPDVLKLGGPTLNILLQFLQDLPPFATAAAGALDTVAKQFDKFMASPGAQEFQNAMVKIEGPEIVAAADGLGRVAGSIGKVWEEFAKGHDIPADTTNFFNDINRVIITTGDWMLRFANNWDRVVGALREGQTDLANWAQEADNGATKVRTAFDNFNRQADRDLGDFDTTVERVFVKDIPQWVGDGIQFVERIPGDFASWLAPSHFVSIGEAAMEGLLHGVEDIGADVLSYVHRLASTVISDVEHIFGVSSPSTVMHEIGMNLGRGLALGIDDSSAGVLASASNLAHRIPGALGATGGGGAQPLRLEIGFDGGTDAISKAAMTLVSHGMRISGGDPRILISKG